MIKPTKILIVTDIPEYLFSISVHSIPLDIYFSKYNIRSSDSGATPPQFYIKTRFFDMKKELLLLKVAHSSFH